MGLKKRSERQMIREAIDKAGVAGIAVIGGVRGASEAEIVSDAFIANADITVIVAVVSAVIMGLSRIQDMVYKFIDRRKENKSK